MMMLMAVTGIKYVRLLRPDSVPTLNLPGMVPIEQHPTEGCSSVCHNVSITNIYYEFLKLKILSCYLPSISYPTAVPLQFLFLEL